MAEISASMVKELRDRTDAPMMECKKALSEANGDIGKAEELLRIKLGNKASKAASRLAAEGVIGVYLSDDCKLGAMVEVNCETDFVARNEDFLQFVHSIARLVAERNPSDVLTLSGYPMKVGIVEEVRKSLVGRIGENLTIRRFSRVQAEGMLSQYVHGTKIGVIVDVVGGGSQLGRDIAMHIAATKPLALSRDQVPVELIEKEREIARAKAAESGKPPAIAEKMVEGTVQKFLRDVTLLGQPFVKDDKISVELLLKSKGARVYGFELLVVGEGLQKKSMDFAAEVRAQADLASRV